VLGWGENFSPAWANDFDEGMRLYREGKFEAAKAIFRPLAEAGDPKAQFRMGVFAERGQGQERDYVLARHWYEASGLQGYVDAQVNIGFLHLRGEGGPASPVEAARWLQRAADQNDPESIFSLGILFHNGHGVERDAGKAVRLYIRAADLNYLPALLEAARFLYHGQDVERNVERALAYWEAAHNRGSKTATYILGLQFVQSKSPYRDLDRAERILRPVAESGDSIAQLFMSQIVLGAKDRSLEDRDLDMLAWLILAEPRLNADVRELSKGTRKDLELDFAAIRAMATPEIWAEAQRRADEWRKRTTKEQ